ncbi:hypothetical protein OSCI_4110052 [Kamptonema sp. PCC 6506]|nr:hypothetical protein OSCI_4110052 [Kamptonema sp. PCC 6506]
MPFPLLLLPLNCTQPQHGTEGKSYKHKCGDDETNESDRTHGVLQQRPQLLKQEKEDSQSDCDEVAGIARDILKKFLHCFSWLYLQFHL